MERKRKAAKFLELLAMKKPGVSSAEPVELVSSFIFLCLLYVQKVVTLQKKYLIYLHQKMRFTPFINYYDTLG